MAASFSLILFSVICGVAGQISLKVGMGQVGQIDPGAFVQPLSLLVRVASSPFVLVGLFLYGFGTVSLLTVLSRVPLSFAYPLLATSYAVTPILAWLVLRESIPSLRWLGILTICLGVFVVSRS